MNLCSFLTQVIPINPSVSKKLARSLLSASFMRSSPLRQLHAILLQFLHLTISGFRRYLGAAVNASLPASPPAIGKTCHSAVALGTTRWLGNPFSLIHHYPPCSFFRSRYSLSCSSRFFCTLPSSSTFLASRHTVPDWLKIMRSTWGKVRRLLAKGFGLW